MFFFILLLGYVIYLIRTSDVIPTGNVCKRLELPPLLENRLKQEWVLQSKTLLQEELEGKYKKTKFSGKFNSTSVK